MGILIRGTASGTKSTTTTEYIAVDGGIEEALWIKMLVGHLTRYEDFTITAHIDSKSIIQRQTNEKSSETQKTVDCMYFAMRDAFEKKEVAIKYYPTQKMIADGLTAALGSTRLQELRAVIGMDGGVRLFHEQGAVGLKNTASDQEHE